MEKMEFQDLQNCYHIVNRCVDLIVATEVGPCILRFGFVGERNEFCVNKTEWGYGAHGLRHAPEAAARYFPDTNPVAIEERDNLIRFTQIKIPPTAIKKEIEISLPLNDNHVKVVHRLYNYCLWPVQVSPWSITRMQVGGKSILPLPPRFPISIGSPLLPTSSIAIWGYCNLSDPRLVLGEKYVILEQNDRIPGAYKLGMLVSNGWLAYYNGGHLFVITYDYQDGARYPDLNSPAECFSTEGTFELETLGPLVTLEPGDLVEHTENWFLFRDVPEPKNDKDIDLNILPLIKKIKNC